MEACSRMAICSSESFTCSIRTASPIALQTGRTLLAPRMLQHCLGQLGLSNLDGHQDGIDPAITLPLGGHSNLSTGNVPRFNG